jgi:hypothetical protein
MGTVHKGDNDDDDDDNNNSNDDDDDDDSNTSNSSGISEDNDSGKFNVVHIPCDRLTHSP